MKETENYNKEVFETLIELAFFSNLTDEKQKEVNELLNKAKSMKQAYLFSFVYWTNSPQNIF